MDALPGLSGTFGTILIDPPWRFQNRTGKMAPEHKRLRRYATMSFDEIAALPVARYAKTPSHLYLWCPNALLPEALGIMASWGFKYKSNIVWYKVRKDGGPDGRGVGFYFRNVTELLLFGVRGSLAHIEAGQNPGQPPVDQKARAFAQAAGSLSDHRAVQPRSVPGAVRPRTCLRAGPNGAMRSIATCSPIIRPTMGIRGEFS